MDDLVERIAGIIRREVEVYCHGDEEDHEIDADCAAKAIIPIVYEDAAKVMDERGSVIMARAIRSRSMTIVGES